MRRDWILDVLADLKAFAATNELPVLAGQLDDAAIVAATEIAALQERTLANLNEEDRSIRTNSGGPGAGRYA